MDRGMMNEHGVRSIQVALVAALTACLTVGCASEPEPAEGFSTVVTLASSLADDPEAIAVDGGYVYWTEFNAGRVMKVPVGGGEPIVVAADQDQPYRVAAREGQVVWGANHRLMMQAAPSLAPVVLATESTYFSDILLDGESIYWGVGGSDGELGQIRRTTRRGGAVETLVHDHDPLDIAIAGGELYWASVVEVGKVPLGGGEARILFPDEEGPEALTVRDDQVYWSNRGGLMRGDKAGGLASSFASERVTLSIESDGESLYWSDFATGSLMKLALGGGGAPIVLVPGPTGSLFVAVDDQWVYWVDREARAVRKVRK
jgi:hypothetical protein